jgi:hypothetical protein
MDGGRDGDEDRGSERVFIGFLNILECQTAAANSDPAAGDRFKPFRPRHITIGADRGEKLF